MQSFPRTHSDPLVSPKGWLVHFSTRVLSFRPAMHVHKHDSRPQPAHLPVFLLVCPCVCPPAQTSRPNLSAQVAIRPVAVQVGVAMLHTYIHAMMA
ncbi:unnamed protein product [Protopolystoma xenopodis]|uniref:Uncharacterized protein n=1 Tax=Protopolystoma xenopodis TaxID=117903 RepID=A0A448XH22_9PLAT|nr:unnamed protein product [Protopolystoma xenopodis]